MENKFTSLVVDRNSSLTMKTIFWVFYVVVLVDVAVFQSTYKAAVVEYAPKTRAQNFSDIVLENVQEYINYIEEAAQEAVDIIVFPENGLTGTYVDPDSVYNISMEIPDPKLQISPCTADTKNYSKALIDLSCSARTHNIYVVVNTFERTNVSGNITYYNTNLVLNREGVIISRFRKINLHLEQYVIPKNETVTFKTDFGVTFGIFTGNDILFQHPALDTIADLSVADIVYPTAWFSELPFLEALSLQHGYAVSTGVNFLVAGLNNPSNKNGGSGIFLSNGQIADIYMSAATSSKMLIAAVPKIDKTNTTEQCRTVMGALPYNTNDDNKENNKRIKWGMLPNISNFDMYQEKMENFTFKDLNLKQSNITEEICIGTDKKLCCSVNLTANVSDTFNYVYKLAIFNGVRELGWETIGTRICGLVACLNTSNASCGLRYSVAPQDTTFKTIFIKAVFLNSQNTHDQPATLSYDLKPLNNYTFCKHTVNDNLVELTLSTSNQNSLLTFGIFGRVYDNDHKSLGLFNNAAIYAISPYIVVMVSVIIFLLQEL